jgi:hypothetical protein
MLVQVVEISEQAQHVTCVCSLVRLNALNDLECSRIDATTNPERLRSTVPSGKVRPSWVLRACRPKRRLVQDRKVGGSVWVSSVSNHQLASKVIEGRPEIVNTVADNGTPPWIEGRGIVCPVEMLVPVVDNLWDEDLGIKVLEVAKLRFERTVMELGSLNLQLDPSNCGIRHGSTFPSYARLNYRGYRIVHVSFGAACYSASQVVRLVRSDRPVVIEQGGAG